MKSHALVATLACAGFLSVPASAVDVNVLDGSQDWMLTDTRPGGTAEIVELTGLGGSLENNAPLPTGALKLTTISDNAAKAEVGIAGDFGRVGDILNGNFSINYSWFDMAPSSVAAPSLKLAFFHDTFAGDGFGQLIYEPYAQGPDANTYITPPQDTWVTETIDLNDGRAWTTGMFGVGSSFAGPPNRTLAEWLTEFDPAFLDARLIGIAIGLGTFNPSEMGYVDDVRIAGTLLDANYDFEVASAVPLPASLPLLLSGIVLAGIQHRRRRSTH